MRFYLALAIAATCGACAGSVQLPAERPLLYGSRTRQFSEEARKAECSSYSGERVYTDEGVGGQRADILVFKPRPNLNAKSLCDISSAEILKPGGLAVDESGKLWVMNSETPSLLMFPHASNGAIQPSQRISGSKTLLVGNEAEGYQGIAVDQAANIWVPCWVDYNGPYGYVLAFANAAAGNTRPIASIGVGDHGVAEHISSPVGVGFDLHGNLYVAEYFPFVVAVFKPPFRDTSKPVEIWSMPASTHEIAQYISVDSANNVYVGGQGGVFVFKNGLKSNGVPWKQITSIYGFYDSKVDSHDRLYGALIGGDPSGKEAIGVWQHPLREPNKIGYIHSPALLDGPGTLALGQ